MPNFSLTNMFKGGLGKCDYSTVLEQHGLKDLNDGERILQTLGYKTFDAQGFWHSMARLTIDARRQGDKVAMDLRIKISSHMHDDIPEFKALEFEGTLSKNANTIKADRLVGRNADMFGVMSMRENNISPEEAFYSEHFKKMNDYLESLRALTFKMESKFDAEHSFDQAGSDLGFELASVFSGESEGRPVINEVVEETLKFMDAESGDNNENLLNHGYGRDIDS